MRFSSGIACGLSFIMPDSIVAFVCLFRWGCCSFGMRWQRDNVLTDGRNRSTILTQYNAWTTNPHYAWRRSIWSSDSNSLVSPIPIAHAFTTARHLWRLERHGDQDRRSYGNSPQQVLSFLHFSPPNKRFSAMGHPGAQ